MSPGRLAGRLALVTGASRGIGQAIAEALQREGAEVLRLARSGPVDLRCDLTREAEVQQAVDGLVKGRRIPDLVVSNAGSFLLKSIVETTPAEFRQQLESNLVGPFLLFRALLPYLLQRGTGHVITIGSVVDRITLPGNAAYGAAKRGLRALHEILALECAGTGIRTTLVSPAATDTTLWDTVAVPDQATLPRREEMLRPRDVAEAVVFAATRPEGEVIEEIRLR